MNLEIDGLVAYGPCGMGIECWSEKLSFASSDALIALRCVHVFDGDCAFVHDHSWVYCVHIWCGV
jgi:hypothetical protein